MLSTGARLLQRFLESNKLSQADIARSVRISPSAVTLWLSGAKRPAPHYRDAIAAWTEDEVPVASWMLASERRIVTRVVPFHALRGAIAGRS